MHDDTTYENIYVARQPVFDAHNETWGYMMLFRDSLDADRAVISDDSEATMNLVANLSLYEGIGGKDARLMIHFTPDDIIRCTPHAVPTKDAVVIIEEMTDPGTPFIKDLQGLRDDGRLIAVNNFEGKEGCERVAEAADVLIVDMHGKSGSDLAAIVAKGKALGAPQFLAKRVENADELALAKSVGFTLFHGYFFKRPQTSAGRKIASSEVARLKLFEIIENDEPDFDALAPAIEADVSISYRLLNFLNSANFSFATTITSIRQAVVLAGWKPIRNWLRLIILTDLTPSEKSQELAYLSAHRAKLFETAALGGGYEEDSDKLFMLGLFSLLDAMFDTNMKDLVQHLPVDDQIKAALCGRDNRFAAWLDLARAIEESDWDLVGEKAKTLNLLPGTVAVSYQHAFTWADTFFASTASGENVQ